LTQCYIDKRKLKIFYCVLCRFVSHHRENSWPWPWPFLAFNTVVQLLLLVRETLLLCVIVLRNLFLRFRQLSMVV